MDLIILVGGIPTPLKNMKVSWDDDSQYMENKIHVPNHQPELNKHRYEFAALLLG